jgi:hypothetical protein
MWQFGKQAEAQEEEIIQMKESIQYEFPKIEPEEEKVLAFGGYDINDSIYKY